MAPSGRRPPPDSRILKMRDYEDRHRSLVEAKVSQQQVLAAAEWEKSTDGKIKAKVIQGRFEYLKGREESKLEERRGRLAEMLQAEEVQMQQVGVRETNIQGLPNQRSAHLGNMHFLRRRYVWLSGPL